MSEWERLENGFGFGFGGSEAIRSVKEQGTEVVFWEKGDGFGGNHKLQTAKRKTKLQ